MRVYPLNSELKSMGLSNLIDGYGFYRAKVSGFALNSEGERCRMFLKFYRKADEGEEINFSPYSNDHPTTISCKCVDYDGLELVPTVRGKFRIQATYMGSYGEQDPKIGDVVWVDLVEHSYKNGFSGIYHGAGRVISDNDLKAFFRESLSSREWLTIGAFYSHYPEPIEWDLNEGGAEIINMYSPTTLQYIASELPIRWVKTSMKSFANNRQWEDCLVESGGLAARRGLIGAIKNNDPLNEDQRYICFGVMQLVNKNGLWHWKQIDELDLQFQNNFCNMYRDINIWWQKLV